MISAHHESNQKENGSCFITLILSMPLYFVRRLVLLVEHTSST